MLFIGVTTGHSSIMSLFPRWAEALGLEATIEGRDVPIGAEAEAYRRAVGEVARHEGVTGALVTTHKVAVYRHARDLFCDVDRWADVCGEVSCISKGEEGLVGYAKDPITAWKALEEQVGPGYWREHPQAEVLCLGAGGSGTALTARLLTDHHLPARVVVTNRSREPLDHLRQVHQRVGVRTTVEYRRVASPNDTDRLLDG
ncbi:MAG: shikimate dehydrogenase, partial [Acidimicrobiia bacterium]